ncbi:uncharacterized protein BDV17DRAFT_257946 [Aspergillus undulatus]|uniref:uncharacterized protein n=1 Tax=Aspergillus undulatus TaxID=1810928 RepID=UPI003CCD60F1
MSPDGKRALAMLYAYSYHESVKSRLGAAIPRSSGSAYIQGNAISAGQDVVAAALYFACWMLLSQDEKHEEG